MYFSDNTRRNSYKYPRGKPRKFSEKLRRHMIFLKVFLLKPITETSQESFNEFLGKFWKFLGKFENFFWNKTCTNPWRSPWRNSSKTYWRNPCSIFGRNPCRHFYRNPWETYFGLILETILPTSVGKLWKISEGSSRETFRRILRRSYEGIPVVITQRIRGRFSWKRTLEKFLRTFLSNPWKSLWWYLSRNSWRNSLFSIF